MSKTYLVYRNGSTDLTEKVKAAFRHYYGLTNTLPLSIVVNPRIQDEAAQVLAGEEIDALSVDSLARKYSKTRAELDYQRRFVAFIAERLGFPAWSDLVAEWSRKNRK